MASLIAYIHIILTLSGIDPGNPRTLYKDGDFVVFLCPDYTIKEPGIRKK
jgi:hypothetical protein